MPHRPTVSLPWRRSGGFIYSERGVKTLLHPAYFPSFEAHAVEGKGVALRRGAGGCSEEGKKEPTVGRKCDLPWVGETTYSRFFRRSTVDRFFRVSKDGAGVLEKEAFRWVERWGKKCR